MGTLSLDRRLEAAETGILLDLATISSSSSSFWEATDDGDSKVGNAGESGAAEREWHGGGVSELAETDDNVRRMLPLEMLAAELLCRKDRTPRKPEPPAEGKSAPKLVPEAGTVGSDVSKDGRRGSACIEPVNSPTNLLLLRVPKDDSSTYGGGFMPDLDCRRPEGTITPGVLRESVQRNPMATARAKDGFNRDKLRRRQ